MSSNKTLSNLFKLIGIILIIIFVLIEVYPIIWMLISSLKSPSEFTSKPMYALPKVLYWKNYADAWNIGNMGIYFRNSLIVTIPSLIFIIFFGAGAAFAIEKMKWKGQNGIMLLFLLGIMVPVQIVLLPLFTMYIKVGLLNNLLGLILIYITFGLPLTIFLFTGFFKAVPNEVIESAVIDGASIYQVFFRICLPMIKNAIVTVILVQFFFVWNDLIFSMTFISDNNLRTLQTGLLNFTGQYGQVQWGPIFASDSMAILPILFLYIFLNKLVMEGMANGAVKG